MFNTIPPNKLGGGQQMVRGNNKRRPDAWCHFLVPLYWRHPQTSHARQHHPSGAPLSFPGRVHNTQCKIKTFSYELRGTLFERPTPTPPPIPTQIDDSLREDGSRCQSLAAPRSDGHAHTTAQLPHDISAGHEGLVHMQLLSLSLCL